MSAPKNDTAPAVPANSGAETRIALAITMFWLLACALYILGVPGALEQSTANVLTLMITFMAMFFPVIVIWTVAYVSNSVRSIQITMTGSSITFTNNNGAVTTYTDADIEGAEAAVSGKKEIDAVVAYLQQLGLLIKAKR